MKKSWMMIITVCLLIAPIVAHAQPDNAYLSKDQREVRIDRLSVSQMEMIPESSRDDQPVVFRAIITNDSRQEVKIVLAVVDRDRIVTQRNEVSLRPGLNQIDFPAANIQFSRKEQRCFTIQTNIGQRLVPIPMATPFCAESSRRDRGIRLSVEGLRMTPDPVSSGQEVSFMVRIRNDGKPLKGNIRIQDSDQVVIQTETVHIAPGVTNFKFPVSRYTFQRMDTCFTVSVDVDRTSHRMDATEEYCADPTAWTLKTRKKDHRRDRNEPGSN